MPKPYSDDLRLRVVAAVSEGASRHEAAERFGVREQSDDEFEDFIGGDRLPLFCGFSLRGCTTKSRYTLRTWS